MYLYLSESSPFIKRVDLRIIENVLLIGTEDRFIFINVAIKLVEIILIPFTEIFIAIDKTAFQFIFKQRIVAGAKEEQAEAI